MYSTASICLKSLTLSAAVAFQQLGLGVGRLTLVGGSHTSKIAALVRHSGITEYIPLPGQPLSSDAADSLEEKISSLDLGEGDILYLDLFSNTIFMGSD